MQGSPRNMGSSRLPFTLACAYYYLSCVELFDKSYEKSEELARESLALLDDLLLQDPPVDKKKPNLGDSWLTGQDASHSTLWIRKATVENQVCKNSFLYKKSVTGFF